MARIYAEHASFTFGVRSPEWQDAFIVRLRDAGLKPASIAKVTGVVLDEPLSRHQVTERLRGVAA